MELPAVGLSSPVKPRAFIAGEVWGDVFSENKAIADLRKRWE